MDKTDIIHTYSRHFCQRGRQSLDGPLFIFSRTYIIPFFLNRDDKTSFDEILCLFHTNTSLTYRSLKKNLSTITRGQSSRNTRKSHQHPLRKRKRYPLTTYTHSHTELITVV